MMKSRSANPDIFYPGFGRPEHHFNEALKKRVLEEIVIASKESVLKHISAYIEKRFKQCVKLGEKEHNVWRRWLKRNQKIWGIILNFSGYTHN